MVEIVLALLIGCNLGLTAAVYKKLYGKTPAQILDEEVEKEAHRRSQAMDEGFDNLMRYSVNGNDGFGGL